MAPMDVMGDGGGDSWFTLFMSCFIHGLHKDGDGTSVATSGGKCWQLAVNKEEIMGWRHRAVEVGAILVGLEEGEGGVGFPLVGKDR